MSQIVWRNIEGELKGFYSDPETNEEIEATWAPQAGSQELFLSCPVFEVLYEGNRGPGKTDALLMDFVQHVEKGFGSEWVGILFRKTYKQLEDVISKSKKWFPLMFPSAKFNESKLVWSFKDGERLFFRHFESPSDYWNYHGHAYPWIGWEELTTWADDKCYKAMFSCARSTAVGVPIFIRSTTNPYGIGHNWVKSRWKLPVNSGRLHGPLITDSKDIQGNPEPPRIAIHAHLSENKILLHSNPDYMDRIRAAARNKSELEAWLHGSWDIVAGGMFDDVWFDVKDKAVVPTFQVPSSWYIDRSFDWGSTRPFSVGWWAVSDGSDLQFPNGRVISTVKGDLFRIAEWYGWNGSPNEGLKITAKEIARGIKDKEKQLGISKRVSPGPADSSIFDEENGNCIATDFEDEGVYWERADKSPGSRKQGWEQLRKRLKATYNDGLPREEAGIFICENCENWTRTVPALPRDDKDLDDVDSKAEDHIADETRYRVRYETRNIKISSSTGLY